MPIVDIFFTKINSEREKTLNPKLKANVSLVLRDPEESQSESGNRKILNFPFEFVLTYETSAKIIIEGLVVFIDEKKKVQELMKDWKKDKEFTRQLYNFALTKCNLKALLIEEQLRLPLHIPLPKLK